MCKRLCKANPAAPQLTHDTPFTTDRLPLPKLNVDGSNPFTRFHLNHFESRTYGIPRIVSGLRRVSRSERCSKRRD